MKVLLAKLWRMHLVESFNMSTIKSSTLHSGKKRSLTYWFCRGFDGVLSRFWSRHDPKGY
jgi:hypothetical protein